MRAVQRLKGLGWLLSCIIVVLGFYMVSLQVASERNKLDAVNLRIANAHRDIRALETEFNTRGNLAQLERWNGEVLALTAPAAAQYVGGEEKFAQLTMTGAGAAPIETASLVIPSPPAIIQARPASVETAAIAPPPAATEAVIHEAPVVAQAVAAVRTVAAVRKAQAVAMLDRKLLSDTTLGDLVSGARREAALR